MTRQRRRTRGKHGDRNVQKERSRDRDNYRSPIFAAGVETWKKRGRRGHGRDGTVAKKRPPYEGKAAAVRIDRGVRYCVRIRQDIRCENRSCGSVTDSSTVVPSPRVTSRPRFSPYDVADEAIPAGTSNETKETPTPPVAL